MQLVCDFEISGQGCVEVHLSELDDLTVAAVEEYASVGVDMKISDEHPFTVRIRPRYSREQLEAALEEERKRREEDE